MLIENLFHITGVGRGRKGAPVRKPQNSVKKRVKKKQYRIEIDQIPKPIERIERLVNGQDVFLFQPTGSGKFECFAASGTSDNQSTKTKHWAQETKQSVK